MASLWNDLAMGISDWFKRNSSDERAATLDTVASPALGYSFGDQSLVKLTGTTTFGLPGIARLIELDTLPANGMHLGRARTVREPNNPSDKNAVAIYLDAHMVGYLPSYLAATISLEPHVTRRVPVQLFSRTVSEKTRTEAWVWIGAGEPQWAFTADDPPPLDSADKRAADAEQRANMVSEALAEGGSRADEFRTGIVDGKHFLELIEPIKQLKREGQLEQALELVYRAIEGAERARHGMEPAPWYTEQAAIIHRKLKQPDQERAVLERWLEHTPEERREGSKISERYSKLKDR